MHQGVKGAMGEMVDDRDCRGHRGALIGDRDPRAHDGDNGGH